MVKQTTQGIQVSVETFYQPDHSDPNHSEFLFVYRITIENFTFFPVQLLSRKWIITDANGVKRIVEGEGVIGKQPIIYPQESYQYVSASTIRTEMGKMAGHYKMQHLQSGEELIVFIPQFQLIAPFKMN